MAVTLQTVAKHAGISAGAVSRILNNKDKEIRIKPETAERVRELARELGYVCNPQARNLRLQTSNLIGVILALPKETNDQSYRLLKGISGAMTSHGMAMMFQDVQDFSGYETCMQRFIEHRVAGIITSQYGNTITGADKRQEEIVNRLFRDGVRIVMLNANIRNCECPFVNADHELGGFLATGHLARLGHRRIAYLGNRNPNSVGYERWLGYQRGLQEHGLDFDESLFLEVFFGRDVPLQVQKLLELKPRPTAVFAWCDSCALSLCRSLSEAGIRVPEDIAVVGFDDRNYASLEPLALTTVTYPMLEIGETAVKILTGESIYKSTLVKPKLIIRKTCGSGKPQAGGEK